MPATPTPWGAFPLPADGDVPAVPTDLTALAAAIDALLKRLIGGDTAPPGSLGIAALQAQYAALVAAVSALGTQVGTLNARMTALEAKVARTVESYVQLAQNQPILIPRVDAVETPITLLTLPPKPYGRLCVALGTLHCWYRRDYVTSVAPTATRLYIGGRYIGRTIESGIEQTHVNLAVRSIPANASWIIQHHLEFHGPYAWPPQEQYRLQVSDLARIYAWCWPYNGTFDPPFPSEGDG